MELANAGEALKAGLRHLIFSEVLAEDATVNVEQLRERVSDERADLRATTDGQRRALASARIDRQEMAVGRAAAHRTRIRTLLWPADEDEVTDG